MNNLSSSMKKFISNKNTITIVGVILCIGILYFGYNMRINQKVSLTRVPYANTTIQPKTQITSDMISYMNVPASFLVGSYYRTSEELIGKYSNYNTMIAAGSLFYKDLIIEKSDLPNSAFLDIDENDTVINYSVNMSSTYANSMMPGDYINIYFKGVADNGQIMFGKFLSNIKILDVKDSSGKHVFDNTDEARTPAYMLFAIPEEMHLLFRKALYMKSSYGVQLLLIPNTQELDEDETAVMISSADIQKYIEEKTQKVSVDEILASTEDQVSEDNNDDTNAG